MSPDFKRLRLQQLDANLEQHRNTPHQPPPRGGWIKEIRKALGMTSRQLGQRMGVSQQAVSAMEAGEADGTITLNSLRKVAEHLSCEVRYVLVPRQSLESIVRERVRELAERHIHSTATTMRLEDQAVSNAHLQRQLDQLVARMMAELPPNLW